MKELQSVQSEKIVLNEVKPIKKELALIGQIKPHKGHTCFQLDIATLKISPAEFESVDINYKVAKGAAPRKKLIAKNGFFYCSCLNKKNAIKVFSKMLDEQFPQTHVH